MKKFSLITLIIIFCSSLASAQSDTTFKASGRVTAQFFGDYFYKVHTGQYSFGSSQYAGVRQDYASFDLRRIFLGYNYDFSPSFTGEILFSYEGNLDGSGNRGLLVKVADIKWKEIFPHADLILGLQFTPAFVPLSEKVWGYRSVEKSLLDKNRIAVPTDVGAGLQGSFDDERNFGYHLLYANGAGTKPETDRYKKLYADLWAKFLEKTVLVEIYGDLNQLREIPQITYQTTKIFAAYQSAPFTVGLEVFMQTQSNAAEVQDFFGISEFKDTRQFGISVFASTDIITGKLRFFVRYDSFDPDQNYDGSLFYASAGYSAATEGFFTTGIDWTPQTSIHIIPNVWYSNYSSKIRGVSGIDKFDYDLVPRITFAFKY